MKAEPPDLTQAFVSRPGAEFYGFYEVSCFTCPPFTMFTANDCPRANDLLQHKSFEPESMRLWCRLGCDASSIIDIGAQVGVYSLAAAALRSDIAIHAFEPNPYAYARLRIHKSINRFENIVEHRVALSNQTGVTRLGWGERGWISPGSNLFLPEQFSKEEKPEAYQEIYTETVRLEDFLEIGVFGERPLIKIDVEGAEVVAIKGMFSILKAVKPDIILETFSQDSCDQLNEMLLPLGYHVWGIDEKTGLHRKESLEPADIKSDSFNQFLSVRAEP